MRELVKSLSMVLVVLIVSGNTSEAQQRRKVSTKVTVFQQGQVVKTITRNHVSIAHNGVSIRYTDGTFFRQQRNSYVVISAPFGIRVKVLPKRSSRIIVAGKVYYYHDGVFYKKLGRSAGYEVVKAPLGARVVSLPKGYRVVSVRGAKYYLLDGQYYRKVSLRNSTYFEVVSV